MATTYGTTMGDGIGFEATLAHLSVFGRRVVTLDQTSTTALDTMLTVHSLDFQDLPYQIKLETK